jgi:hypothetical protein
MPSHIEGATPQLGLAGRSRPLAESPSLPEAARGRCGTWHEKRLGGRASTPTSRWSFGVGSFAPPSTGSHREGTGKQMPLTVICRTVPDAAAAVSPLTPSRKIAPPQLPRIHRADHPHWPLVPGLLTALSGSVPASGRDNARTDRGFVLTLRAGAEYPASVS